MKSFLNKVRSTIEANKTVTAAKLIISLNSMIRGWANYHRHKVAKYVYNCADHHIWQKIWRWCRRKHPNKGTIPGGHKRSAYKGLSRMR
ncbi:hypothetical protein M5G07_04380 [Serratia symbiotica]|nr:hypothetical protein [Serratia symbiotica]